MLDYAKLEKSLKEHLESLTPEQFRAELEASNPHLFTTPKDREPELFLPAPNGAPWFMRNEVNFVGNQIRKIRMGRYLTREDVALAASDIITAEMLKQIEETPDKCSEVTLLQLRVIAHILRVSVSELVEP